MTHIRSITPTQKHTLNEFHKDFEKKTKLTGYSAAAASFLLIGALIVITCGCLCLMLPGVNIINDVILRAVVPGSLAIVVSIPFIVLAIKNKREANLFRGQMINQMISHLQQEKVYLWDRKKRTNFILHNFLNWQYDDSHKLIKNTSWGNKYQEKILGDLKEKVGKNKKTRNPAQEKIATALDKARGKIAK